MKFASSCLFAIAAALSASAYASPPQPFTAESFAQIRARHAGKPLVVHLWGLTCAPCLVELPKWGALLHQRRDMNVAFIEVDPAPPSASEQTLEKAGLAKAESWGVTAPLDEYLRASIDPKWIGDIPRTLLISPSGEITRIRGVADLGQVSRWLDSWPSAGGPSARASHPATPAGR